MNNPYMTAADHRQNRKKYKSSQARKVRDEEYALALGQGTKSLSTKTGKMVKKGKRKHWHPDQGRCAICTPARRLPQRQPVVTVRQGEVVRKIYTTPQGKAYADYIQSKAWAKKRAQYWSKAGRSCKKVGCGTSRDLHVHHHTYDRLGEELMSDLVGLCHSHHDEVHNFHKKNRHLSLTEATERIVGIKLT